MKYKYFLFDWDGTLAHTMPPWITAVRKVLKKRGITKTDSQIVINVLANLDTCLPLAGVTDVKECIEEILALDEILTIHTRPLHDEILPIMRRLLKKDIRTAVVTNTWEHVIMNSLQLHDVHDLFHSVVSGDRVKNRKPHPEPLLTALSDLGALEQKDISIMIGDSPTDILAAKAAKIPVALHYPVVHEGYYKYSYIKSLKPDYIIRDFAEILDLT